MFQQLSVHRVHEPSDPRAYAVFRMLFGAILFVQLIQFQGAGLVRMGLVGPKILFPYEGFEWLRPMPEGAMHALLIGLSIAAIGVVLGAFYRVATIFLFIGFTYILLLDKGYYNNHYYLFSLIAFLMIWVPANRAWSIDRRFLVRNMSDQVPRWCWLLLRAQIVIVYFYGGLAKLNGDWLSNGEPMRSYLATMAQGSAWTDVITSAVVIQFFVIGGLLFDLCAGPLLWWKRSRIYVLPFVLFFNLANHWLFDDIGVFPFFMICATILFFDPEEIAAFFGKRTGQKGQRARSAVPVADPGRGRTWVNVAIALYLAIQFLFPFRWLLMPEDPDWTGIAQRFSWRMKITTRNQLLIEYRVEDPRTGKTHPVNVNTYINNHQSDLCAFDPGASVRFARFLKEEVGRRGMENAQVKTRIVISYNGRPYRYLWPPDQDLAVVVADRSRPSDWIPSLNAPELELAPDAVAELRRMRSQVVRRRR